MYVLHEVLGITLVVSVGMEQVEIAEALCTTDYNNLLDQRFSFKNFND